MFRHTVTRLIGALVAAAVLGVGGPVVLAAEASAVSTKPVRPGPVTGLTMNLTKPSGNFSVTAIWSAATAATSYVVALSNATTGAVLVTNTVTVTNWSASVPLTGVTQVRLTVTPYATKFSGPAQTITQAVPDLSAPTGTFAVSWVDRLGTITQTSLSDDGPIASVTKTVNWGDNTLAVSWSNNNPITHTYAADGLYRPTVTLKDGAGNTAVIQLAAIVPGDKTAPVGTFTTSPGQGWDKLTPINLTQTALSDDFSPAANVLRNIDWGDGTAVAAWVETVSAVHTYAVAGTFTPQVILRDEAGNTRQVAAPAVVVSHDAVAPVVKLLPPRKSVDEISSWKPLKGTATDKGTGVTTVSVVAIEKRTKGWYFYQATAKTWALAATKAKAWKRSKAAVLTPTAKGAWAVRLVGLRQGTLFYKASATDLAGNASATVANKAVLTAP